MAFFSFKNLFNDKLLTQGSVLEFFPCVTQNSCVMLSEDIKLEGCLY